MKKVTVFVPIQMYVDGEDGIVDEVHRVLQEIQDHIGHGNNITLNIDLVTESEIVADDEE